MQEMVTYRKTLRITSILFLVVFMFASSHPVKAYSIGKSPRTAYQSHFENLAVSFNPDWQTALPAGDTLLKDVVWRSVGLSKSLCVNAVAFTYILGIPTINAP